MPDALPPQTLGERLRSARAAAGLGVRELGRRIGVSGSMISQIEKGISRPSVSTLYAIANELGVTLDGLFTPAAPAEPVTVRRNGEHSVMPLGEGVTYTLLGVDHERALRFLRIVFEVGGVSGAPDSAMRHGGGEYGYVHSGRLGVTVGDETHELGPGDTVTLDPQLPHRIFNAGDIPAELFWVFVGR
ncbi:helix-turn-helix domain-containing protein [Allokutzneria albata]|uniref:Helix-turn-helix domain-containing protein n=1 Tax=Allokutzneria albata TaxID=211114 RepID=A0A1G9SVX3_ALLAB|nr:XRE family transcriptional regulator [Allokutzneria albata]SDM39596.1 Helix-turn-helix domain-containing protein [Allokutzneria albata]